MTTPSPTDSEVTEELEPCPWCPTKRRELYPTEGGIVGVIIHDASCFLGSSERRQVLTPRGVTAWNTRVRASVAAPQEEGISWTALLSVLERLRSKNRNPDNEWYHGWNAAIQCLINDINARATTQAGEVSAAPVPIDMILLCPRCGTQHIDAEEDETGFRHRMEAFSLVAEPQDRFPTRWTNPPHKSHLCHNCYAVWRPADVPTNGVAKIKTRGKDDNTWTNAAAVPADAPLAAPVANDAEELARQIVGTVFDNTGASHETLKQVMIERITDAIVVGHVSLPAERTEVEGETVSTHLGDLPLSLIDEIYERRLTVYKGFEYRTSPIIAGRMKTDLDYLIAFAIALKPAPTTISDSARRAATEIHPVDCLKHPHCIEEREKRIQRSVAIISKHFPTTESRCAHNVPVGYGCHYCPDTVAVSATPGDNDAQSSSSSASDTLSGHLPTHAPNT